MNAIGVLGRGSVLAILLAWGCGDATPSDVGRQTSKATGSVSVTPTTDLLDEQELAFAVSGWDTTLYLGYVQCAAGASSLDDCNGYHAGYLDSSGSLTGTLAVQRWFWSKNGNFVSCRAAGACVFVIVQKSDDFSDAQAVPLSFRDVGPVAPPKPVMTVTPNTGLKNYQYVTINASGFPPEQGVLVAQCPAGFTSPETQCQYAQGAMWADSEGNASMQVEVLYWILRGADAEFTCEGPGACVLHAFRENQSVSAPITFIPVGSARRGSVQVPGTLSDAVEFVVTGAGWASNAELEIGFCSADAAEESACRYAGLLTADAQGAFSHTNALPAFYDYALNQYVDCTARPGACVVQVRDTREPAATMAQAPLTFQSAGMRGSAAVDPLSPRVAGAAIRATGSGFSPNRALLPLLCKGPGFDSCKWTDVAPYEVHTPFVTDAAGAFRAYPRFVPDPECYTTPSPCSFVVGDPRGMTATAVRIPLVFTAAEAISVASQYEPEFESLFQQGLEISGFSPAELQLQGGARMLWILAYGGTAAGPHLSRSGAYSHSTTYTRAEYVAWAERAARLDYTVDEFQKVGALFWSWIIAGMPPLPTPASGG